MLSTDEDRALESAASFFNGFYLENSKNLTDKCNLLDKWEPFPIHSVGYNVEDVVK